MTENDTTGSEDVLDAILSFQRTRLVATAVELAVFDALADIPRERDELVDALGLDQRAAADFLDALVALGLLTRAGPRYANSAAAARFLVSGRQEYMGGYAAFASSRMMPLWGSLTEAILTGRPQVPTDRGMMRGFDDLEATRSFLGAMDSVNAVVGEHLVRDLAWTDSALVVDLGGARGNLLCRLCRVYPHLEGICLDRAALEPYFQEHVEALGVADRLSFQAGDFLTDPLPRADVYVLGHVLHFLTEEERVALLRRVREAMAPGGKVVVYDRMIDADRSGGVLSLLGSLNMLLTSPGGSEYTPTQLAGWMTGAGLGSTTLLERRCVDALLIGEAGS